jgi:hypothetical protein
VRYDFASRAVPLRRGSVGRPVMGILQRIFRTPQQPGTNAELHLTVSPEGFSHSGACLDCGERTSVIWSLVDDHNGAYAVYYARWTPGHRDRGAQLYVSLHGWGEGADATQRVAVGLDSRMGDDRPMFTVIDAHDLAWSTHSNLGRPLTREQAFSSGAAAEAFNVVDHALEQDERLRAFFLTGR